MSKDINTIVYAIKARIRSITKELDKLRELEDELQGYIEPLDATKDDLGDALSYLNSAADNMSQYV